MCRIFFHTAIERNFRLDARHENARAKGRVKLINELKLIPKMNKFQNPVTKLLLYCIVFGLVAKRVVWNGALSNIMSKHGGRRVCPKDSDLC